MKLLITFDNNQVGVLNVVKLLQKLFLQPAGEATALGAFMSNGLAILRAVKLTLNTFSFYFVVYLRHIILCLGGCEMVLF